MGVKIIKEKSQETRINDEITTPEVRLIDAEGNQVGVVPVAKALRMAMDLSLDLVEISPTAVPPVCRIMNHGKFLFEQNKQKSEAKKKQKVTQVKEIKLRPATDVADYQVKLRKIIEFLNEGDKVKITLRFRGREMAHKELGDGMMERLEKDLTEFGDVESRPKVEGRQMMMMVGPKRSKK